MGELEDSTMAFVWDHSEQNTHSQNKFWLNKHIYCNNIRRLRHLK